MPHPLDQILAEFNVTARDIEVSLGLTGEAVRQWRTGKRLIPVEKAQQIEQKFGVPKHRLRPDVWDPPPAKPSRKSGAAASA